MFLLLAPAAYAFCGTFVSGSGELFNEASEIAVVREGTRTTLTMANDFSGDPTEFAMVVPVPQVLSEDDVAVVDPAVFDRLRAYSAPRLVSYTCDELYPDPNERGAVSDVGWGGWGCTNYAPSSDDYDEGGVEVEAEFIVGEYEIVVLSAEDSSGLMSWLNANGYAVSLKAEELLQEYIDSGSYFFAAKVFTDRMPAGQANLSPLQFRYDSEVFSLPIRLGTVNSAGSQDLVVYAVTSLSDGRVGVANYEERELESLCLVEQEAFSTLYSDSFTAAVEGDGDDQANWVTEYGWSIQNSAVKCDPCPEGVDPSQPIPAGDVLTLGYGVDEGGLDTGWWGYSPEFYFTRLHMRYTPHQAQEDLLLYSSGLSDNTQHRFVVYEEYLEVEWPVCGEGFVENPGSCADVDRKYASRIRAANADEEGGCSSKAGPEGRALALLAGLLTLMVSSRR